MIYLRIGLAFLGACLMAFSVVKVVWEFVKWAVMTMSEQGPPFVDGNPRIPYRVEAFSFSAGAALVFAAAIL